MSKEKKILILGAAGFIGVNLCRFYLKKNYKVTGVDNFHLGTKKNIDSLKKEFGNQFSFKEIDILVFKNLKKIPKKKFLKIINLVANSDISKSNSNSLLDVNLNFITMVNVLDYFKNFKKTKFFFSSTSAIYGKNAINVNEKTKNLNPVSLYGSTKLACEKFIQSFYQYHKLNHVIFRFPNVTGPHLTHGIIFDFIKKLKKTNYQSLDILGNGSQKKNYIYVDDLCEAIFLAMKKKIHGIETYNIMTNGNTSVKEIVNIFKKKIKKNFKTSYGKNNVGWVGDVNKYSYKTNKIRKIGWSPKIKNSTDAIKKTIELYIK